MIILHNYNELTEFGSQKIKWTANINLNKISSIAVRADIVDLPCKKYAPKLTFKFKNDNEYAFVSDAKCDFFTNDTKVYLNEQFIARISAYGVHTVIKDIHNQVLMELYSDSIPRRLRWALCHGISFSEAKKYAVQGDLMVGNGYILSTIIVPATRRCLIYKKDLALLSKTDEEIFHSLSEMEQIFILFFSVRSFCCHQLATKYPRATSSPTKDFPQIPSCIPILDSQHNIILSINPDDLNVKLSNALRLRSYIYSNLPVIFSCILTSIFPICSIYCTITHWDRRGWDMLIPYCGFIFGLGMTWLCHWSFNISTPLHFPLNLHDNKTA